MAAVSRTVNRSELITDGGSLAPIDEVGIVSCLAFLRQRAKPEVLQQRLIQSAHFSTMFCAFCSGLFLIFGNITMLNILLLFRENHGLLWPNVAFTKWFNWKWDLARKNPKKPQKTKPATSQQYFRFPVIWNFSSIHLAPTKNPVSNFTSSQATFLQSIWKFLKLEVEEAALKHKC